MFWAYLGPGRKQAAAAAHRRLRRRRHDPHARPRVVPVNWLQIMENSLDPIHTEWLHGHTYEFIKEQQGQAHKVAISARHEKIAFREFEHGITKHRLLAGHSEDSDDWKVGHPVVFPNILSVGNGDESRLALLRVPDPRAGGRHPHHAPLVHGLRAAEGREGRRSTARQGPRLRRAVHGRERRLHPRQHRRPGHDGVGHARRRSPTAPRRTSAPPTTASRSIAACCAARSRRSRKASTRCSPSAIRRKNVRIDLPNERKKHHNSEGMRSWIMRTHAAYSPIAEDVMPDVRGAQAARRRPLRAASS